MKNLILPAKAISAAMLCQGKNDIRYYLCGVHIDKRHIMGTNGHVLFRCDHSGFLDRNVFPEGGITVSLPRRPPARAEYAVFNTIDKNRGIVDYYTSSHTANDDPNPKSRYHIQGDVFTIIDGKYPDTEKLFQEKPKAVESIGVRGEYLGLSEKIFKCVDPGYQSSVMHFFGDEKALMMKTRNDAPLSCEMLIMPMRVY